MTERGRKPPRLSPGGQAALAARRARLAEALRENLRKRSAQRRQRAAAPADGSGPSRRGGGAGGGEA